MTTHNCSITSVLKRSGIVAAAMLALGTGTANAAIYDLINSTSATVNNAFFAKGGTSGTGSGNFDAFLRFNNTGTETGFSSNNGIYSPPTPVYDNVPGNFTFSPLISDFNIYADATSGNVNFDYFQLSLDLLENPNSPEITIQTLELWTSNTANAIYTDFGGATAATKVWELGDNQIDLISAGGGQGNSDYYALFDAALLNSGDYFYIYNIFGSAPPSLVSLNVNGGTGNYPSSPNFEEWGYSSMSAVPVPAAVWLFGTALVGLVGFSKRRKAA